MKINPSFVKLADLCPAAENHRYPAANGVRLVRMANGDLLAEVTDGRRLVRLQDRNCEGKDGSDYPRDIPVTVSARGWELLCNLADPKGPGGQEVALALEVSEMALVLTGTAPCGTTLRLTYPRQQGKYPDTAAVIPIQKPEFSFRVSATMLAELLATVAPFSDDAGAVVAFHNSQTGIVKVTCISDGVEVVALLTTLSPH